MVQYAGHHPPADRLVWREDGDRWAAFWLAGDRLVAALTVDRPRDLVQARRLMERGATVDAARLADPARRRSRTPSAGCPGGPWTGRLPGAAWQAGRVTDLDSSRRWCRPG